MPGTYDNTTLRYGRCKFWAYGSQNGTRRLRDASAELAGMELVNQDKSWLGSQYDVMKRKFDVTDSVLSQLTPRR